MVAFAALLWTIVISQSLPPSSTATQPPPTGLIVGRVVDGTTGRPVGGAIVALDGGGIGGGPSAPRAMTSGTGQFVFRKLPKGSYQLRASRMGYSNGSYGQRRPGGVSASLQLEDGQRLGDAVIPIWKHATISGTVVDEAGEPLVNVQVRAFERRFVAGRPRVTQASSTTTDDRGFFRFGSLVPGDYLVAFVWREAAVPAATAELMRNDPGAMNDPKNVDLMRERSIVGSAFSSAGTAGAMQVGGMLRDLPFAAPVPPPSAESGPLFIYPTQFYPGVASAARARAITLASGESRDGIDFALRPAKTARVSGTVLGPNGPMANTAVRLVSATDDALTDIETSATLTGAGGEFTLLGVPPGQFTLKVQRVPRPSMQDTTVVTQIQVGASTLMTSSSGGGPDTGPPPVSDDPTLVADVPIAVGESDINDILIPLQRAARVTGRFEFDGSAQRPDGTALMRLSVSLLPVDGSRPATPFLAVPSGRGDETGGFKTYGVPAGRYTLGASAPPGWTFRSATAGGRDLSAPFDIAGTDIKDVVVTFSDRPTKLSGAVRAANGSADLTALVVVFPADAANLTEAASNPRRVRVARTDRNGAYSFNGLPAGEYYVGAIHEETTPEWQDPQALENLARSASQVRLAEGESRTQDVKAGGGAL